MQKTHTHTCAHMRACTRIHTKHYVDPYCSLFSFSFLHVCVCVCLSGFVAPWLSPWGGPGWIRELRRHPARRGAAAGIAPPVCWLSVWRTLFCGRLHWLSHLNSFILLMCSSCWRFYSAAVWTKARRRPLIWRCCRSLRKYPENDTCDFTGKESVV